MSTSTSRFWIASAGGLLVVGACAGGVLVVRSAEPAATPTVRLPSAATTPTDRATGDLSTGTVNIPAIATARYKDGRFTVTGRYLTPGGDESIGVTVDLAGGVVTAATVRTEASSPTARQFQEQFRQHISVEVIARDLASLSVARVAGASLTSVGFNDALNRIRSEAHR